ncbi:MAG: signal peptidase I, partial [Bacteroidota bacterium]
MSRRSTPDATPTAEPSPNGRAARPGRRTKKEKVKPTLKENVRFYVKAILIILFLRVFLFEPYRIPSESMEDTLLVGDFLIVSKLHYGARTPNTIGVPFTRIYLPGLEFPQTRLPGFSEPQRGDVVVFNYPAPVDVAVGPISADVPIERRGPYIKRLVAVPGDTLAVIDKMLILNQEEVPLTETQRQGWWVYSETQERPTKRQLAEQDVLLQDGFDQITPDGTRRFKVDAAPGTARALESIPGIARVEPWITRDSVTYRDLTLPGQLDLIYPPALAWNPDQYGPLILPGEGVTIE